MHPLLLLLLPAPSLLLLLLVLLMLLHCPLHRGLVALLNQLLPCLLGLLGLLLLRRPWYLHWLLLRDWH